MKPLSQLDHYEVLDVARNASEEEIRAAFNFLLETYSPSSIANYSMLPDEEHRALLARLHEAYFVLSDANRRASYDRELGVGVGATAEEPVSSAAERRDVSPLAELWSRIRSSVQDWINERVPGIGFIRGRQPKRTGAVSLSMGKYIETIREQKGLTLEEVAEQTKIKVRFLAAIEEEDYGSLPSGAYGAFILKAFVEALGLDIDQISSEFNPEEHFGKSWRRSRK